MKKRILLIMLTALLSNACSKDNNQSDQLTPVRFSSNITSRAANNAWNAKDSVGIYMINENTTLSATTVADNVFNRKYITVDESGTFTPATDDNMIYFPQNGEKVDFVVYYPYTSEIINLMVPINVSDQTSQSAIDLLYSTNAKGYSKTKIDVDLTFAHQLSKLSFVLKAGKGVSTEDLVRTVITIKGMNTTANFSLKNGSLGQYGNIAQITAIKTGDDREAIVLPSTATSGIVFNFELDGLNYIYTVSDDIKAGKKHVYNVTMNRAELPSVTATVTDWVIEKQSIDANN